VTGLDEKTSKLFVLICWLNQKFMKQLIKYQK